MLNDKGDTLVCFTVAQSKYLLKQVYRVAEYDTLLKVCEKQKSLCDTINAKNERIIYNCYSVNDRNDKMLKVKDYQIDKLTESLKASNKEIRKQKVYKWIAKGSAITIAGCFGCYALLHH